MFRTNISFTIWRSTYLLCAIFCLSGMEANSVLSTTYAGTAVSLPPQQAVSLSFIAPSKSQAKSFDPIENTMASKPVTPGTTDARQITYPSSSSPHREPAKKEAKSQNTRQEPEETANTTSVDHSGIHSKPLITEPIFTTPPKPPRYPTLARKRSQEGTVLLEIWLDIAGRQSRLVILESSGTPVLDQAAMAAVSRWQFKPYRENGVGVESRVRVPIEFALR